MESILIVDAVIVSEGKRRQGDVHVVDGRIAAVGGDLSGRTADRVIEAAGRHLLPGLIDDQVHFREPGLTHKGDIGTESGAAVAGGVTSFMEMPNTSPPTLDEERLEAKCAIAARTSHANYAFYLGASNDNLESVKAMDPQAACGVKVFMGASTGNMLVDDPKVLEGIFTHAPVPVAVHCEDTPTILRNEAEFRSRFGEDVPADCHPRIRSEEACYRSSALAVDLARKTGARLHLLHLTTARELDLLSESPLAEKTVTAEVCVHHLFFHDGDYADKGHLIKCNPSIKTRADREALRRALVDGRIDVIATDHAPHTLEEKRRPYFSSPSGLPLVQHSLPVLLELVEKGCENMVHMIGVIRKAGINPVVCINRFYTDTDAECAVVRKAAEAAGARCAESKHWEKGGDGALEFADAVIDACNDENDFKFLYPLEMKLRDRVEIIAKEVYGADGVDWQPEANAKAEMLENDPKYADFATMMVKTHLSLSHDPVKKGVPKGWRLPIRDVLIYSGAKFLCPCAGTISLMPGTSSNPAFRRIDVEPETGKVTGLF